MRAAVLTTSPATIASPSAGRAPMLTSASPVLTATLSCRSSCSAIQSRIASAARTARSGSSSCTSGAPNTAITASPMNFSTVPPCRSSSARTWAWYGESTPRTSSGSSRSACAVNPTRSTKITVTVFRSSRSAPSSVWSGLAHALQNRAPSGFCSPQFAHVNTGKAYDARTLRSCFAHAGRKQAKLATRHTRRR
jgi:hypothetical protein